MSVEEEYSSDDSSERDWGVFPEVDQHFIVTERLLAELISEAVQTKKHNSYQLLLSELSTFHHFLVKVVEETREAEIEINALNKKISSSSKQLNTLVKERDVATSKLQELEQAISSSCELPDVTKPQRLRISRGEFAHLSIKVNTLMTQLTQAKADLKESQNSRDIAETKFQTINDSYRHLLSVCRSIADERNSLSSSLKDVYEHVLTAPEVPVPLPSQVIPSDPKFSPPPPLPFAIPEPQHKQHQLVSSHEFSVPLNIDKSHANDATGGNLRECILKINKLTSDSEFLEGQLKEMKDKFLASCKGSEHLETEKIILLEDISTLKQERNNALLERDTINNLLQQQTKIHYKEKNHLMSQLREIQKKSGEQILPSSPAGLHRNQNIATVIAPGDVSSKSKYSFIKKTRGKLSMSGTNVPFMQSPQTNRNSTEIKPIILDNSKQSRVLSYADESHEYTISNKPDSTDKLATSALRHTISAFSSSYLSEKQRIDAILSDSSSLNDYSSTRQRYSFADRTSTYSIDNSSLLPSTTGNPTNLLQSLSVSDRTPNPSELLFFSLDPDSKKDSLV